MLAIKHAKYVLWRLQWDKLFTELKIVCVSMYVLYVYVYVYVYVPVYVYVYVCMYVYV